MNYLMAITMVPICAGMLQWLKWIYYKTPILYRNMGIEMFCNFVDDSIKEATFTAYLW
jgi:hypothetical protein